MTSLLFGIYISALLSLTSLLVVLFRVSPLSSPGYALPAFFISLFLAVSSIGALVFYVIWHLLPLHSWDAGKMLSVSLRQGIFLACATVLSVFLFLLGVLTWWVALMVVAVFVLIEVALDVY
jgi:hypothetical protein